MSHWTQVKTTFKIKDSLIAALKEMFPRNDVKENVSVRGYRGRTENVDIVLCSNLDLSAYDVGFKKSEDGTYTYLVDWWGAKRIFGDKETFETKLKQGYAKHVVRFQARKFGWKIQESQREDGSIHLKLTKY